jgi:hypothetical protein
MQTPFSDFEVITCGQTVAQTGMAKLIATFLETFITKELKTRAYVHATSEVGIDVQAVQGNACLTQAIVLHL